MESIDPWIVAGISFETDEFTEIAEDIEVGSLVHVEGQVLADGTWLATEISLLDENEPIVVTFVGTVESMDPWLVSGVSLATDEDTAVDEGIEVGDTVRVTAVILPDGSFLATTIELVEDDGFPAGCFTIATTILSISGNVIEIEGLPPITLGDDITIEGELTPNVIIIVSLCVSENGDVTIITIIVIYTPPTPIAPPGGGDDDDGEVGGNGRITICHKGRNTITISQSALSAHLGHGDYVGVCQSNGGG